MADAVKGDFIQIHFVILEPGDRPATLPESTRRAPYEAWIKGFLVDDRASAGDRVRIRTLIGREMAGVLAEAKPRYEHGFGRPRPELLPIGQELSARLGRNGG